MTVPPKLTRARRLEALSHVAGLTRDVFDALITDHGAAVPAAVRSALDRVVASLLDLRSAVSAARTGGSEPVTPAASKTPPESA